MEPGPWRSRPLVLPQAGRRPARDLGEEDQKCMEKFIYLFLNIMKV